MTNLSVSKPAGSKPWLAALFGVERNEGRAVILMVTLYFILSAAFVLVQTTAFALFIEEFGSHGLPYAYLSTAALGPLIAYLYLKASERLSFASALFLNLGFLTVVCLVFWVGLESPVRHGFIFLLPFWFQTLVNLANIVVWHAAGHLFNVRQAKRIYGLIGAGNWLANIVGGFAVAAVLTVTGSANAYLLAAFAVIMGALVLRPVLKLMTSAGTPQPAPSPAADGKAVASPLRHPYSRLIFAYTLLWWLGFCFVDNIFYDRAGVQLPSGAQLAGFIAQQLSVMGVIAIITSTFLTSLIARRYGLRTGLLIMPVATTASILLLAAGGTLGWGSSALFWIAAVAKTLNVALGFSLSLAMGSLLFQPLLGNQRGATQTISEGIVQPVAIGLAGVILLVFNTTLHFNAIGLSYLFIPVAVLWFVVIFRLSREYPLVMSEALMKRGLGETTTLLLDSSAEAQLRKSLRHPKPGLALYALNQLQQLSPQTWPQTLLDELSDLLVHPAAEVREEALNRLLELRPAAAVPIVRRRLALETSPRVYALLIQVLASMRDQQSDPQVLSALDSPERTVRRGAIIGLISFGSAENSRRAGETLDYLASSADVEDRLLAADVVGQCNYAGAHPLITALLEDDAISVRHAAIRAAGHQQGADYLRSILRACDHPETAHVAEQVLASKGLRALEVISEEFRRESGTSIPRERLLSIIRILGRIPGPASTDLLLTKIGVPEAQARLQALLSLSALGFRARSPSLILQQVTREIDLAGSIAAAIEALHGLDSPTRISILKAALETAFQESRRRILLLLSFVLDEQALLRAYRALDETSASYSPLALETVDALLPVRFKPLVLPLIEDVTHGRRLELWRAAGVNASLPTPEMALQSLMTSAPENPHSPWTRLCAIYAAVVLRARTCAPTLRDLLADPHPAIREMSRWGLERLSGDGSHQGDTTMLSLVEKVLILKSAPIFGDTPDNVLADIAGRVEEISYEPGQVVFNKGDRGDSLYIIVSGKVQVWDDKRKLNELTEGDVFGELALLDPEPRLASVKAVESTEVLRLDEAHFREVLAARPEVSTAIIRVITRYLRSQLQYAREISARMRASESFGAFAEPVRDSG